MTNGKFDAQAEMLANRIKKKFKHLKKKFEKQNIEVFRLYDWDIPEIRAAVDWYAGHLVIAEYTRRQSDPKWLPVMAAKVAQTLGVSDDKVHLKLRKAGKQDGRRYERINYTDAKIIMSERDLKFYVNPYDYVDTGLFSDHRDTRGMVRELASGKEFLNLYCYTGSFSCYAAKGGAKSTVSVDRSETAVNWTRENFTLNDIPTKTNRVIQAPTYDYLSKAKDEGLTFDLAVVDPPSYSTSKESADEFDILKDHPDLLAKVLKVMNKGSILFFSTNHQGFKPEMDHLAVSDITEITSRTIPEDYVSKRKTIHRCWKICV